MSQLGYGKSLGRGSSQLFVVSSTSSVSGNVVVARVVQQCERKNARMVPRTCRRTVVDVGWLAGARDDGPAAAAAAGERTSTAT